MDQQFSLSWNNFHGNLTKGFAGLLGKGEFVDVTIAVEGHLLQAHKVILSICSPYFKKMFQLNPCQHPIVVLRDVTHKSMRDLLNFMYHGEVSVKREDLTAFISTAEVLQIKGLTNKETEEDEREKDPEPDPEVDLSKQGRESQTTTPNTRVSCNSEPSDTVATQTITNTETELSKQREFIEKLQRLNNLKRKSEEYLQKNYFSDILRIDKRSKTVENISYHKQSQLPTNNYESLKSLYDEMPLNITKSYNMVQMLNSKEMDDKCTDQIPEIELKTECEDIETGAEPAGCTTPKHYDGVREKNDLSLPLDFQTPQDSALSLVMNGCESPTLPARYRYIYSRKGHKQLVHRNFVYTKHSTTHGKTSWRCVQYFSLNRCPATVETIDAMIYAVNHQHNHEDCYEKLAGNSIYEMNMSPDNL